MGPRADGVVDNLRSKVKVAEHKQEVLQSQVNQLVQDTNKLHDKFQHLEMTWSKKYNEAWEEHHKWKTTALEWKSKNQTLRGRLTECQDQLKKNTAQQADPESQQKHSVMIEVTKTPQSDTD